MAITRLQGGVPKRLQGGGMKKTAIFVTSKRFHSGFFIVMKIELG
jgi:hypothetical protein